MVREQPAATAAHVDVGTFNYGAGLHTAWRGSYPVLITAGAGPRAYPGSMRGARGNSVQWVQEPRDQGEIVRQYTKIDHRLDHTDNPGLIVSRLLQVAMSEPRGPVYMTVPQEAAMLPLPGKTRFPTRDELGVARPGMARPVGREARRGVAGEGGEPGRHPRAVGPQQRVGRTARAARGAARAADDGLRPHDDDELPDDAPALRHGSDRRAGRRGGRHRDAGAVYAVERAAPRHEDRVGGPGPGAVALQDDGVPRRRVAAGVGGAVRRSGLRAGPQGC